MFDEKYKNRYLFFSIFITVIVVETLIIFYTHFMTPSQKPHIITTMVHLKISKKKMIKKDDKRRVIKNPKPKLKHIVKPKPKPKPKRIIKYKLKQTIKRNVKQSPRRLIKHVVATATKSIVPKPIIAAQALHLQKMAHLRALYLQKVRELIEENKYYPRIAKRLRQTGKVEVEFTIQKNGDIKGIKVFLPCRYRKLNHAAIKTLENIGHFEPLPTIFKANSLTVRVPINYKLR